MGVIGLNYTKILAERTGNSAQTDINTSPRITNIKETKVEGIGSGFEVIAVDFVFESIFKPKIGTLSLEGVMIYKPNNEKHKDEIMKLWKKEKQLPPEVHMEIINHLFRKVSLQALHLADIMQLPPVINLPRLVMEKVEDKGKN